MGLAGPRDPGRDLGSVAVPPGRAGGRPPWRGEHGHADLRRGGRCVPVVAVRAGVRRGGPGGRADELRLARAGQRRGCHLPGGRVGGDRAGPARPLLRGPGQAALGCGAAGAAVAGRQGRRGAPRRRRGPGSGSGAGRGRGVRRPPRREDRGRRGRGVGPFGRGYLDAHRRACSGRGGPGRGGDRRMRERRWAAGDPRDPGRRRYPARAAGPAGHRGPGGQGAGAAAGRPDLGGVRAGRHRYRGRDADRVARGGTVAPGRRSPPRSRC